MPRPLVLVGAGEFAQIACEYFRHDSDYDVLAFSVEREYLAQPVLADCPVVPYEALEQHYPPEEVELFVAVPASQLNRLRRRFYLDAKRRGYRFASYVSTRAFVWRNAVVGENCFIFEGNVVQPFVRIGDGSFVGVNATFNDGVKVAPDNVIGAGALVTRDTEPGRVYVGSPAKAVPDRSSFDVRL
jgi:hypothetical protein